VIQGTGVIDEDIETTVFVSGVNKIKQLIRLGDVGFNQRRLTALLNNSFVGGVSPIFGLDRTSPLITVAPALPKASAIARPMPELAPVTATV
jgi:hypothetical protein